MRPLQKIKVNEKSLVYKKAAQRIFYKDDHYACHAICISKSIFFGEKCEELDLFKRMFQPEGPEDMFTGWFGDIFDPENQLARQLALLFMAEIAKENK